MPDPVDPIPSQAPPDPSAAAARPDPDMPPRKLLAGGKLRKPITEKQRAAAEQRLEHLRARLLLRPLNGPSPRALPPPHEDALRALGLLDFARLDLAADTPRPDLVAPLVAYYDAACKRSFVRGVRVAVSRSDLARALSLPSKAASAASAAPPDVDPAVAAPAVLQLLQDYVLLPFQGDDDMCILPQEVVAAEQAVKDGSAHRVDWAGLIWGLVEKEMLELPNRDDCVCYYGPHLQRLILAQKPILFELAQEGEAEEGDKGEIAPEASVDVEIEDGDADVKSKSVEELELGNHDVGADMRSQGLEEPELGNADARSSGLYELELGGTGKRDKILEEPEWGDVDVTSRDIDNFEVLNEESRIKSSGNEDEHRNSLDELEAREEYTKAMCLDESDNEDDHAKGGNLDEESRIKSSGDEDEHRNSLDELEAREEYTKAMRVDESDNEDDHAKGGNLDEESRIKSSGDEDEHRNSVDELEAREEYTKAMRLDESDNEDYHAKGGNLDEESRIKSSGDEDEHRNGVDELEARKEYTKAMRLDESDNEDYHAKGGNLDEESRIKSSGDEDEHRNSLDELEAREEYTKAMSLDESYSEDDHANGGNLDELGLEFVAQAMPSTNDMMDADNEDAAEATLERGDDVVVPAEDEGEVPLVETVAARQMEMVAVPEEVVDEDAEGEEEKDATGLSLGISSANGYDSVDLEDEDEADAENLDEGESDNEEAESSEDGAFEECRDGDSMNWRMGEGKEDGGLAHCLQRSNSSACGSMQFENLNKEDVEMRDELRFDDFPGRGSLERMTSSNLLQAMNSIPASYNMTDNVHDLSSGDFLAMGADANKNGMNLGPGSSYFFGNNGKRHIGDIDGFNDNMQVQEQFPQCNQQKRLRHNNSRSISTVPADFNANFAAPMQNLIVEASKFYEQKDQEIQSLKMEKQYLTGMLQEKDAMIQSLNSAMSEQQNRWQAELRHFEHDLNVMAQLATGYKKALKCTRATFDEYRKKFPCNKPRYDDVPDGGGLVLTVKELEKRQLEVEQQKLAAANDTIGKFEQEWFSKLNEQMSSVHSLWSRMEQLSKETHLIKETRKAKFEAPVSE